jgi:hypothetical protein
MTDKPDAKPPVFTEAIPSAEGKLSGVASANAPVVFFDATPTFGHYNGIAHISLSAIRFIPGDGRVMTDSFFVAHLRTNMVGLQALKNAIQQIELLAEPVPEGAKN